MLDRKEKKTMVRVMGAWGLAVVIIFFFGKTIFANIAQLSGFNFIFHASYLVASFLIYGLGFVVMSVGSFLILRKLKCEVSFGTNLQYLLFGQFGSYVPGKIWLYVIRYNLLKKHGVTQSDCFTLFAVESVHLLSSAGILAFIFLSKFFFDSRIYVWILAILVLGMLIALYPKVFYPISNQLYLLTKRPTVSDDRRLSYGTLLSAFVFASGYWLCMAFAFFVFVKSFADVGIENLPLLLGTFLAAYWLGIVAIFAPSGLGVREGVFVFALAGLFPVSIAALIAVMTRLWSASNEILWAGTAYAVSFMSRGKNYYGTKEK